MGALVVQFIEPPPGAAQGHIPVKAAVVVEDLHGGQAVFGEKALHFGGGVPPIVVVALEQVLLSRQGVDEPEILQRFLQAHAPGQVAAQHGDVILRQHGESLPDAGHILLVVADAPLEESNLPVQLPAGGLQGRHLLPNCLQGRVLLPQGPAQLLRLPVQAVQRHVLLLQHEGGRGVILLRLFGGSRNFVQVLQPDCNLQSPELLFVCQVISGLF